MAPPARKTDWALRAHRAPSPSPHEVTQPMCPRWSGKRRNSFALTRPVAHSAARRAAQGASAGAQSACARVAVTLATRDDQERREAPGAPGPRRRMPRRCASLRQATRPRLTPPTAAFHTGASPCGAGVGAEVYVELSVREVD